MQSRPKPTPSVGVSSAARRTPTAARVPAFASCTPRDRPRFLAHRGFFRKYRDIQPRGVVKASSGESTDWFSFQAFHPTAPHNASLHLLCDFDPLRLDVATRHSPPRSRATNTHSAANFSALWALSMSSFVIGSPPVFWRSPHSPPIEFPPTPKHHLAVRVPSPSMSSMNILPSMHDSRLGDGAKPGPFLHLASVDDG